MSTVAGTDAGSALAAVAASPSLTITVAELLANDRPGPANESGQSLTVTSVSTGSFTHGTVTLANGVVTYVPDAGFGGTAAFTYRACDDGTTAGQPDPRCSDAAPSRSRSRTIRRRSTRSP
jgi:hypothetical protein